MAYRSVAMLPNTVAYRAETSLSRALFERAKRVMPGGNSRHSVALAPYPIYVKSGSGARVTDVDGEERVDFLNNYTSTILGHADPRVMEAIHKHLDAGTAFSMPTEHDVALAELICGRVSYIDQVRFCNSGSEAIMLAIKAARAYTGRSKIAKFEGAYHGIYDYAQASEGAMPDQWGDADAPTPTIDGGISPNLRGDVVILPWNRPEVCARLLEKHGREIACLVVDALPSAIGLIAPQAGFLESLRKVTQSLGILYLSDEVMSFRLGYHGALHGTGVEADLTALGKVIGGGFPVGAVAGKEGPMAVFDHTKEMKVHHGGTFNANPVTMVAGIETMRQMTPEAFASLDAMGDSMRGKLRDLFAERGMSAQVMGRGSLFIAHLTDAPLTDYRSMIAYRAVGTIDFGQLCHEMLGRGIVTSTRGVFGCLSTAMEEADLDAFVTALDASLSAMG